MIQKERDENYTERKMWKRDSKKDVIDTERQMWKKVMIRRKRWDWYRKTNVKKGNDKKKKVRLIQKDKCKKR